MQALRDACAEVARRAQHVRIHHPALPDFASGLPLGAAPPPYQAADPALVPAGPERERVAAFWLILDAINFGSGWFPTLRKRDGHSGYDTIAAGLTEHFQREGPWSAAELCDLDARTVARVLGQDPEHELMALFAVSLRDAGQHVRTEHRGEFARVVDEAAGSAVALARHLGAWASFGDTSTYDELSIAFLKRAQIAAADLARAHIASFTDLDRLTMFADNLVPHVLRLDGVLHFDAGLVARIERDELIEHGSREEVEIRACALHAVELIVAAVPGSRAADVDQLLWHRGREPRYKASPRHRSRCTAY